MNVNWKTYSLIMRRNGLWKKNLEYRDDAHRIDQQPVGGAGKKKDGTRMILHIYEGLATSGRACCVCKNERSVSMRTGSWWGWRSGHLQIKMVVVYLWAAASSTNSIRSFYWFGHSTSHKPIISRSVHSENERTFAAGSGIVEQHRHIAGCGRIDLRGISSSD